MEIIWKFPEFQNIVKTILKFAGPSGAFEASNHVFLDSSEIVLVSPFGGAVWFSDKELEQPLVLPILVLQRIASLSAKYKEIKIVKLEERWEIRIGRIRMELPTVIDVQWSLPDFSVDEMLPLPVEVFGIMKELIFSASEDVRRNNLYGIWYSGTDKCLYSSDNYRVTRTKETVPFGEKNNVFLPREFLDQVFKLEEAPEGLSFGERALMLYHEKFLCFSLMQEVKMPPFASVFERELGKKDDACFIELDLPSDLISDFGLFLKEEDVWSNLKVSVEESRVLVKSTLGTGSVFELEFPLQNKVEKAVQFEVNSRFFLEAILKFGSFHIVSDICLFFENERFEHLVFLLVN